MSKRKNRKETPEGLVRRMIKDGVDCSQRYANEIVDALAEQFDMTADGAQDLIDGILEGTRDKATDTLTNEMIMKALGGAI